MTIQRDSTNELYDRASDLLLAAEGVRKAAAEPGSAPAIAGTLGCVEASLEALRHAIAAMRREADRELSSGAGPEGRSAREAFSDLMVALESAHLAADRLRDRTGPMLARLSAV